MCFDVIAVYHIDLTWAEVFLSSHDRKKPGYRTPLTVSEAPHSPPDTCLSPGGSVFPARFDTRLVGRRRVSGDAVPPGKKQWSIGVTDRWALILGNRTCPGDTSTSDAVPTAVHHTSVYLITSP